MTESTLWVVSPVYRDVPSYLVLRKAILNTLDDGLGAQFAGVRFVVVDDSGGLDDDIERLRRLDDVTLVQPPFNMGHQRALVFGIRSVAPQVRDLDVVVTLDADGEDRPEDIPRLIAPLVAAPNNLAGLVLALRTKRHEPATFRVLYFFYRILFRSLTGVKMRSGNYAAYRGWLTRQVLTHPHFDLCYSSTLISLDIPVEYVPCARGSRYAGRPHMTYSKLLMHGLRMLMPFVEQITIRALIGFSALF